MRIKSSRISTKKKTDSSGCWWGCGTGATRIYTFSAGRSTTKDPALEKCSAASCKGTHTYHVTHSTRTHIPKRICVCVHKKPWTKNFLGVLFTLPRNDEFFGSFIPSTYINQWARNSLLRMPRRIECLCLQKKQTNCTKVFIGNLHIIIKNWK